MGDNVPLQSTDLHSSVPGPVQSDVLNSLELVSQILEAQHFSRMRSTQERSTQNCVPYDLAIIDHARKQLDYATKRLRQVMGVGSSISPETNDSTQYVNVRACLKSATELLHHRLQNVLVVEWLPSDLPKVYASSDEFREICYNLLLNAILGLGGKIGRITVEAVTQMPSENWPGGVRLRFVDTGAAVNEDYLHLLFKPSFFLERPRRIDGLLLYITMRLAEKNGGRLISYGCHDSATAFCVDLPSRPVFPR